jgi:RNA polymerase sigma-70 factor (ECF subfamily)
MQEVAVVLWDKFDKFRQNGDFRAWAFGVAKFKVLSWLRDKSRSKLVLADDVLQLIADESVAEEPRLEKQRRALESCVSKLDPNLRDLLLAAYQPGTRIQDVATTSGRSIAGFYQWLHRMRQLLLDCVNAEIRTMALA